MDVTSSSLEPPLATGATTQPQHQEDDRAFTDSKPTMEELQQIIKTMRNGASPGPDGLNAKFYKHTWPWIASDVYKLVIDFYNTALMQPELNQTFLVLLPEKTQSVTPQDFRPISLCNVIYKLIAKTLANRLKPHLPNFIDQASLILFTIDIFLLMWLLPRKLSIASTLRIGNSRLSSSRLTWQKPSTDWNGVLSETPSSA